LFYEDNDDASKLCLPDEKHNTLWELAVLPTGLLELRTGAGSVVTSVMHSTDDGDDGSNHGLVSWERSDGIGGWNHVCLIFSSQSDSSLTEVSASLIMNGAVVVPSAIVSVNPFGSESDTDLNQDDIEDAMEKTVLIFGIGPSVGFRLTELRVWACQRSEDDVKMMMYEYLQDAEMKKKFKVNIRKGSKKKSTSIGGGGLLAPPPAPPPIRLPQPESKKGFALAPPPRASPSKRSMPKATDNDFANFGENSRGEDAQTPTSKVDPVEDVAEDKLSGFAKFEEMAEEEAQTPVEVNGTDELYPEEALVVNSVGKDSIDPPEGVVEAEASSEFGVERIKEMVENENSDPNNAQLWNDLAKVESTMKVGRPPTPTSSLGGGAPEEEDTGPQKSSIEVLFSDLLSTKVRQSAAGAIIRGPPAARHFGGNRGGLASEHINFGYKCDGVSPIAICGAEKSVVWFSDRDPPGRTYPIGASGAVLSDIMDENQSEYMCCFLAKEKRMVVFELSRKTVVVELQMKTKLNFWRYLPPEAHGSALAFVLITPIGGFHWKPLDESPRPFQVWKRGPELEAKKILSYEEGGSNGQTGADARSTIALVLASSASPALTVEAYCIVMDNESSQFCISNVVLGAALCRPPAAPAYFLPCVVTISEDVTSKVVLDIEDLWEESGTIARGIIASTVLDFGGTDSDGFAPPSMSMGPLPEALCCCHDDFIVAVIRRKGAVFAYDFSSGDLVLIGKSDVGQYIVDAAIRSSSVENEVELVLLLCENDNLKDGRVATVNISRVDGISSQHLSSI